MSHTQSHTTRWMLVLVPTLIATAVSLRAILNVPTFGPANGPHLGGPSVGFVALLATGTIGGGLVIGLALAALAPQFLRSPPKRSA